ncbi:hypothetical protein QAD02_021676 [Eretmocerus hayati]|uniref:Uncharacterized protein n=1 Tax=Eretmocerus hayati TaxID=131215 RepID=A0ACC2PQX9_9HYME|nr:hypothetical protein QAD02_021676 [Eretmocerus hayati]
MSGGNPRPARGRLLGWEANGGPAPESTQRNHRLTVERKARERDGELQRLATTVEDRPNPEATAIANCNDAPALASSGESTEESSDSSQDEESSNDGNVDPHVQANLDEF